MTDMASPAVMRAWARIVRTKQRLQDAVERDLKHEGLPPLEWYDVLLELSRAPEGRLALKDIEREMLLAQYNLSRLIDRLEAKGLVRRLEFPGDRRRQLIEITAEGRTLRERMWPVYAASLQRHVGARITEAEAEAIFNLLGKFAS